jgi:hypothetical protein
MATIIIIIVVRGEEAVWSASELSTWDIVWDP